MKKVWMVNCLDSNGEQAAMLCGSEALARVVLDIMQRAADENQEPLNEYFSGSYSIEERLVAESREELPEAWPLRKYLNLKELQEIPEEWRETLKPLLGGD